MRRVFLRNWREALELPKERHVDTFNDCGNLFAAGIPINFDRAISDGTLKTGDVVMMAAFAHAGDFAGAAAIKWGGRGCMAIPSPDLTGRGRRVTRSAEPVGAVAQRESVSAASAVRSALIESIDSANRYPEFLPERLRSLIAAPRRRW